MKKIPTLEELVPEGFHKGPFGQAMKAGAELILERLKTYERPRGAQCTAKYVTSSHPGGTSYYQCTNPLGHRGKHSNPRAKKVWAEMEHWG